MTYEFWMLFALVVFMGLTNMHLHWNVRKRMDLHGNWLTRHGDWIVYLVSGKPEDRPASPDDKTLLKNENE